MNRRSPAENPRQNPDPRSAEESPPDSTDPLRVQICPDPPGSSTLLVTGEIDLATSPLLRDHAMDQLERSPDLLVLNLQQVEFLGSAGLAVLVEIRAEALRREVRLRLVTTAPAVLRALTATGLVELFDVSADSEAQPEG